METLTLHLLGALFSLEANLMKQLNWKKVSKEKPACLQIIPPVNSMQMGICNGNEIGTMYEFSAQCLSGVFP